MENVTTPNTTILLNENQYGITITRKNFKKRSVIYVRDEDNVLIARKRLDNVDVAYETKYMNWKNYDHHGGWNYSNEVLVDQFVQDKKLFADIVVWSTKTKEYEYIKSKVEELEKMDNVIVHHHEKESGFHVTLVKAGCVADYIDVEKVIDAYWKFGIDFDVDEIDELMSLSHAPMTEFINVRTNKFGFDFGSPGSRVRYMFNGMLLGYPIESTVAKSDYYKY